MTATADFWRQKDLVGQDQLDFPVTLVGAGGIGSHAALALAKMGCRTIDAWDHDRVEVHNLPNQLYSVAHLGKAKVEALREVVGGLTDTWIGTHEASYPDGPVSSGVVISAVDSMASRSRIWDAIRYNAAVELYVDARMGAEVCRIQAVYPTEPASIERYEATLYSDDASVEEACTARAIAYKTFAAASLVALQVKRHAVGDVVPRQVVLDLKTLTLLTDDV
jgi:tRNA A37 threonylcarbamoyladenosine dehydratase